MIQAAQRVAGAGLGQLCHSADISGVQPLDLNLLFALHHINLADFFIGILVHVIHGGVGRHHAGIHLKIRQLSDIGIGNRFKYQCGQGVCHVNFQA